MAAARALRLFTSNPTADHHGLLRALPRRRLKTSSSTMPEGAGAGAGDIRVHSGGPPEEDYPDQPAKFSGAEEATRRPEKHLPPSPTASSDKERVPPPFAPSGKLESQEVTGATDASSFSQKRRLSRTPPGPEAATCVGDIGGGEGDGAGREEEVVGDKEYYETHKPSPIAEMEFADTRKPLMQATDGTATDRHALDVAGRGLMVPDTVDEALARAEAVFREAASRGNPAWPHSRALERMLMQRKEGADGSRAPWSS